MRHEFIFAGESHEVIADHLERSFGRLTTCPKVDQQACDDGTIALNLDSVLAIADQMRAAQELFEESEKYFNDPALGVNQCDDLCGNVE